MAQYLSAGVYVQETDASTIVPSVSNNVGFFAGNFHSGPVDQPYVITTRKELIDTFGLPSDANYNEWFQASKFLDYANQLIITRGYENYILPAAGKETTSDVPALVGEYVSYIAPAATTPGITTSYDASFDIVLDENNPVLPAFEVGDLITLGATFAGGDRTKLVKVAEIEPLTTVGVTPVTIIRVFVEKFGSLPTITNEGKIYLHSAAYKNGESEAFERGAGVETDFPVLDEFGDVVGTDVVTVLTYPNNAVN